MTAALRRPDRIKSAELITQASDLTAGQDYPQTHTGWTLDDLRSASRVAAARCRMDPATAREADLCDVALSACGLAVAENPHAEWSDVVASGQRAIWDAVSTSREQHGISSRGDKPRFSAYWLDWSRPSWPSAQCETAMALRSVLDQLPSRHRETLLLLAFAESMDEAAEHAGVCPVAFRQRVRTARAAALRAWFDHELPPALARLPINRRARERACPAGHLISGDNLIERMEGGRMTTRCKTCRAEQRSRHRRRDG